MAIKTGEQVCATDIQNLTFFPKGTILMYDGQLWDRTGGIPGWHICNGEEGTVNLVEKFIRGGTTARQTGGTDTTQLPQHTHTISDEGHNHTLTDKGHSHVTYWTSGWCEGSGRRGGAEYGDTGSSGEGTHSAKTGISIASASTGISIANEGVVGADNRPAFCSLIFIEKMTPYLY